AEADWQFGQPDAMLRCVFRLANHSRLVSHILKATAERKLRLFYCACFRLHAPAGRGHDLADVIERYADGAAPRRDLGRARQQAAVLDATERAARWAGNGAAAERPSGLNLLVTAAYIHRALRRGWAPTAHPVGDSVQAAVLRDLFGDPFRLVEFEPAWRTGDV